ncbi:MAG TPA: hypothetical protein VFH63_11420 [candidate division Zixibacteria bacterium]|nr:hypothetical protein [candidate division Zixibacteria bacterium]
MTRGALGAWRWWCSDDPDCVRLMEELIAQHAELWNEDIGET